MSRGCAGPLTRCAGRLASGMALAIAASAAAALLPPPAAAASLTNPMWTVSKTTTGATAVTYAYSFAAASSSSLSSVTMTVPPGTGGSPAISTVSPPALAGGSVTLAGTTLTYSFTSVQVASGTAISIQVGGLINTSTAGSYTSQVTTANGGTQVDTGTTAAVIMTATALSSPVWSASSTTVGAAGVSYTYTFTTATTALLTSFTMTVPPGTAGSPTVGAVSPPMAGATVSLSGTTLTLSGISLALAGGSPVSIQINGLTNTASAGSYTSEIVTNSALGAVDSGVTAAVSLAGILSLTSPSSLTWTATLTGNNASVADTVAGDQQFSVDDETGTGAGWHITVAATTLVNGSHTLADAGTFLVTGSISSASATTAPSVSCTASCIPPSITTTYPVAITTAPSSPTPVTVCDVSAGTGTGPVTIGGHTASNPVGWWVNVPANALAGSYTTTITVAIVSGP
jgi:hypothetical protein